MHPNEYHVDEAWIVFQLNDAPLRTDRDGLFNIVCLMDAASCFILGNAFVPSDDAEPSTTEVQRLLETGWAHHHKFPTELLVPTGQFPTNVPEEAARQGIEVVRVKEGKLLPFIREARDSYKAYEKAQRSARYN